MRNNHSHYLHQMSQPTTPRSPSLSPRVRFPHHYPTLQFPLPVSPRCNYYPNQQPSGSPVYAFPYVDVPTSNSWSLINHTPSARAYQLSPTGVYPYPAATSWPSSSPRPSPLGVSPRRLDIGRRFGLVPATPTPRSRAVEEDAARQWWPSTVELVGRGSVSCNDGARKGRGIGPVDEATPRRLDRFKIRTVDLEEMIIVKDEDKK